MPKIRQRVGEENIIIMKKILFFAFIALSLVLAGCRGSGSHLQQPSTTGYIQFQNLTNDSYFVEVDGYSPFTLGANKVKTYEYEVGVYYMTATQKDGYILYPTVQTATVRVYAGETSIVYWK